MPLGGRGHGLFVVVRKRLKNEKKAAFSKKLCIPIFFKVVQGNPIKYLLLTFLRDFQKLFLKYVSDSCQKEKPSRSKLSSEGQN